MPFARYLSGRDAVNRLIWRNAQFRPWRIIETGGSGGEHNRAKARTIDDVDITLRRRTK